MNTEPNHQYEQPAVASPTPSGPPQPVAPVPPQKPKKAKQPMSRRTFAVCVVVISLLVSVTGASAVAYFFSTQSSNNTSTVINKQSVVSQEGELVADVASKVSPSVVSIITESRGRTYFGLSTNQSAAGSGVIISRDGYVVTNKHVVSSSAGSIEVILSDGTSYKDVKFIGSDPSNDISFLKIQGVTDLTAAALGDSSKTKVGEKVLAIGNALGEYQNTVTMGIISALGRPVVAGDENGSSTETLENLLQTDAAINPGNSGGPLVNLSGEVIGINTAVASDAQGIGFAIPVNDIKGMVKTLLADGKVVKPYIGVRYVSLTPALAKQYNLSVNNGAYIVGDDGQPAIASGSPADTAGLREKDIITKVNGTAVDGTHPFASLIAQQSVGDKVTITYLRDGKESTVTVTLVART